MNLLPGLPRNQRNAIFARAYQRFGDMPIEGSSRTGDSIEFDRMLVGNLYVLTFRYTNGFVPVNNTQQQDVMAALSGGYAQDHVLVSVAKVVRKLSWGDELEVELEQPVCMSYKNGPTVGSSRFALHRDGHVKYFKRDDDPASLETADWNHHQPQWTHTRYPVLPVVVSGCDHLDLLLPPVAAAAGEGGGCAGAGVKRSRV
jgi:hypothetical protein